jgi:NAD-dependent deacetylase
MTRGSDLDLLKGTIAAARAVTILTGAGISADSGVPTFRGADGLWRNYRAEDLATPAAFERNPRLVWEWYDWRRQQIITKQPNDAHYAVVELERRCAQFWLITQNVDGLHRVAGSRKLSEIHGNIWMVRCTECAQVEENREVPIEILPTCKKCGGLLRPHIVWFGESLDQQDLTRCDGALRNCDVLLIIGTSGVVYPAAGFAARAKEAGAFVAELNVDDTPHTSVVDLSLRGRAKELMPLLVAEGQG